MKKNNSGFTLIELLVVIAIIGILSSIVIASLNSARNKGKDAAIKGQMKQLQTQAEIFYDSNTNSYNGSGGAVVSTAAGCNSTTNTTNFTGSVFANPSVVGQVALVANNDAPNSSVLCSTNSSGNAWALTITGLNSGNSYCVDNSGNLKNASTTTNGVCN